jgi:hypothetical protein
LEDLKAILLTIAERLEGIEGNTKVLAGRLDAIEPELTNVAIVVAETNRMVGELHSKLIETTDRHGARLHALEHPANGKAAQ